MKRALKELSNDMSHDDESKPVKELKSSRLFLGKMLKAIIERTKTLPH